MPAKVTTDKEMVDVFVPGNDMKDKTPVPVTINGYRYLVPVNQRVSVPKGVAEVLEHRRHMLERAAAFDAENAQ